ncbi:2-phospho-L-lactate guanylyltransferase [Sporichthya brevicatena]|uniref:Phosphoenolpyruvate guanylyltransferase n=1 Tax=Sporichthya brevicatena TaxID=171442 RepID=A0ABN1H840_9ACTN
MSTTGQQGRDGESDAGWCLVVPVKLLHLAKSRLSTEASHRSALALAFAADTVAAALRTSSVVEVVVVTDDPTAAALVTELGAAVVSDAPDAGLNPALRHGAAEASSRHPGCAIGALSADLPALKSTELATALQRAGKVGRGVVADAVGTGTTAYLVAAGEFTPLFGADSLRAHIAAGAVAIRADDLPSVRRDVDTPADLTEALGLGVGEYTRRALDRL